MKNKSEEIQSYLSDASYMLGGHADRVAIPESISDVVEIVSSANQTRTALTVSGAGTGTVGGRVAFGGIVLATDRLNKISTVVRNNDGTGYAVVGPGVVLSDLQQAVEKESLLYPPDPTEKGCFIGGNVATNASGARTFKYGPTRNYIERLKIVLTNGEVLDLRRGHLFVDDDGVVRIPLPSGATLEAPLPKYQMPHTRKNATGYFVKPGMDVIDLFIGSEGTLGIVVEIEVRLIPRPDGLLSGVVFFEQEDDVLLFVRDARAKSLENRAARNARGLDARALEFFDRESLNFLREKYPTIPENAAGAVFFEQETDSKSEDALLAEWLGLVEEHHANPDSWFANNPQDHARLREFRHQLPVLMNEWFARYEQRKVSTDMAVPDEEFAGLLRLYQETLRTSGLRYTIFGHIGDNHVHVNILPRDDVEGARARELYVEFLKYTAAHGGTLSAEHGVGKLKRDYLKYFYSAEQLREMVTLKRAFDPNLILSPGTLIPT
ncbi:MAG TPA: FAD-binding oxidoreductase [Pyrinomonadaceae bacterium]|nr:FAD-binding oxidoreductase [Pyrinomonadaceae bacterium]